MALKTILQPRHMKDPAAIVTQVGQLQLTGQVLGSALDPQHRFKGRTIDKIDLLQVDDEIDNPLAFDGIFDGLSRGLSVGGSEVRTARRQHADAVVLVTLHHDAFCIRRRAAACPEASWPAPDDCGAGHATGRRRSSEMHR